MMSRSSFGKQMKPGLMKGLRLPPKPKAPTSGKAAKMKAIKPLRLPRGRLR